jgi:membrane-associated phospholipid phosphatase
MGHLAVVGLIIVPFHRDVSHWGVVPLLHAGLCLAAAELVRLDARAPHPLVRFARTFYPVLWIGFAWIELNRLVTMVFPMWGSRWVVEADLRLFGVHPTVWVERWFRPWLTELMNFFYAAYYLFPAVVSLPLYFSGRRREASAFLFLTVFTIAVNFLIFFFVPAEGAWIALRHAHTLEPEGGFFLALIRWLQSHGSSRGCAFPSSHVAAAFAMALAGLRTLRRVGLVLLPLSFGVAMATVYCRYHHAVDALAGMLLGPLLYWTGLRILKARGLA